MFLLAVINRKRFGSNQYCSICSDHVASIDYLNIIEKFVLHSSEHLYGMTKIDRETYGYFVWDVLLSTKQQLGSFLDHQTTSSLRLLVGVGFFSWILFDNLFNKKIYRFVYIN